jgi:hypothetical protein
LTRINDRLIGYIGEKKMYLYAPCKDHKRLDVLDRIRVAMVQNREKPAVIQMVTRDYLSISEKAWGLSGRPQTPSVERR